jgi:putative phosphoesterase
MFKIGVISDTHGHLDPRVPGLFSAAEVQHILHAGDIGLPWLILQLEEIAPVTAVTGNTDAGLHLKYREAELVELAGLKFLIHHIVDVHAPAPALQRRMIRDNPDAVIFGHSHKPFSEQVNGRLYFNPGYAGKSRFGLPRSIAILSCEGKIIAPELKYLD